MTISFWKLLWLGRWIRFSGDKDLLVLEQLVGIAIHSLSEFYNQYE